MKKTTRPRRLHVCSSASQASTPSTINTCSPDVSDPGDSLRHYASLEVRHLVVALCYVSSLNAFYSDYNYALACLISTLHFPPYHPPFVVLPNDNRLLMGSQLAKGDHQQQQHQSPNSRTATRRTQPVSSSRPYTSTSSSSSLSPPSSAKAIVVVNAGPSAATSTGLQSQKRRQPPLPQRPLIPIGQTQVNPNFPHLSPTPIIDLGLEFERELRTNAELVACEQSKLIEKIKEIDSQVTASSVNIGAERQRRFNKAVDNFGKFDEIDALIQRVETDIENILTVFVQLNDALPDSLCLEQFALRT